MVKLNVEKITKNEQRIFGYAAAPFYNGWQC